jgi:hypothetical protein
MRALLPLAALLAGLPPAASAQEVKSVFAGADPDIEMADGQYWIYPTGGDGLSAWSSPDKAKWTKSDPLIRLKDIAWADDDRAPAVGAADGRPGRRGRAARTGDHLRGLPHRPAPGRG